MGWHLTRVKSGQGLFSRERGGKECLLRFPLLFTTASRKTAHHHRSTRGIFIHHRARKTVSSSASTWKRSLLRWFQAWNRYASKLTRWNPKDPVNAVPSISIWIIRWGGLKSRDFDSPSLELIRISVVHRVTNEKWNEVLTSF